MANKVLWCGVKRPVKEQRKELQKIGDIEYLRTTNPAMLKILQGKDTKALEYACGELAKQLDDYVIVGMAGSFLAQFMFGSVVQSQMPCFLSRVLFSVKKEGVEKYACHNMGTGNKSCCHAYFVNMLGETII